MKNKLKVVPALAILGLAVGLAKVVAVYDTKQVSVKLDNCNFVAKQKSYNINGNTVEVNEVCGPSKELNADFQVQFSYNYAVDTENGEKVDLSNCNFDAVKGLVCETNTPTEYRLQLDGLVYVTYSNGQFTCTDKFGNNAVTANTFKECLVKYFAQGVENAPVDVAVNGKEVDIMINAKANKEVFEVGASDDVLVFYNYYTKNAYDFGVSSKEDNTFVLSEVANSAFANKVRGIIKDAAEAVAAFATTQTQEQTTTTQPTTTQPNETQTTQATQPQEQATQPTQAQGQVTQEQTAQQTTQEQTQATQVTQNKTTQAQQAAKQAKQAKQTQTQGGLPVVYIVAIAVVIAAVAGAVYFLKQKKQGGEAA